MLTHMQKIKKLQEKFNKPSTCTSHYSMIMVWLVFRCWRTFNFLINSTLFVQCFYSHMMLRCTYYLMLFIKTSMWLSRLLQPHPQHPSVPIQERKLRLLVHIFNLNMADKLECREKNDRTHIYQHITVTEFQAGIMCRMQIFICITPKWTFASYWKRGGNGSDMSSEWPTSKISTDWRTGQIKITWSWTMKEKLMAVWLT